MLHSRREEIPALYYATENGFSDIVQILASDNNININSEYIQIMPYPPDHWHYFRNDLTETSLVVAARKGYNKIIQILLQHPNINPNYVNELHYKNDWEDEGEGMVLTSEKASALHVAVYKEKVDAVKILVECPKVDVNLIMDYYSYGEEYWNETPLHIAVDKSNVKIVEILLSSPRIDVNIKSYTSSVKEHQTALHMAVKKGNIEIIQLLLNHKGIDFNAVDKDGKKPID